MKNLIAHLSTRKAALIVGVAFISSALLVTLVDDFLIANFVIPGDTEALANDIQAMGKSFNLAVVGYLLVLALDALIGMALYVVLKPANKNLALLTGVLRVLYACILTIGVIALALQFIGVYAYASIKLIGYVFFALHILVLGYAVFKSGFIPKSLGILLMVASLTYVVFFVDTDLSEALLGGIMGTMALAELSLSVWLIVKRNVLPEKDGFLK